MFPSPCEERQQKRTGAGRNSSSATSTVGAIGVREPLNSAEALSSVMAPWRASSTRGYIGHDRHGQKIYRFKNGYGASVINYGYGAQAGLYELAVLDENDELVYDTPVTPDGDVLGWLTKAEVQATLSKISRLPKRTRQSVMAGMERSADLRYPGTGRRRPEVRVSTHTRRKGK